MKSLDRNKARLGVGLTTLVFLLAGTARANERSSAISGPTGAQASLALQVTDPQPVVFDAWDVIKSFETRTCTILEGHSGYRDLLHSQFNQLYPIATSPAPVRYFRKQTVTSSWSFQNGLFSGDMNFTIQKDNKDVAVFGPGTLHMTYLNADRSPRESWVNKDATLPVYRQTPILSDKGYVPGTYNLGSETRVVFPGTVHTTGGGAVDAQDVSCATPNDLDVGFRPIYLGADQINPIVAYPIAPLFGNKITLWNATKIVFNTDQVRNTPGTLNYTLELSDEDTLTNVQSRIDAGWQANALDTLRWGFDRMVEGPWVSDRPIPPNENIIYLYNTHDFAFWGFLQEARGQLRFNVPPALQVPGVSYRGRVLEVFYPDSDTYNGQVVKIHEVEMKAGQWQSPVITPVMRPEDGETDLMAFSVVAEPIQPHSILSLPSSNPSTDKAPPEYQKTRPTIAAQDLVTAGAGTRNVLTGSLTLQQINLSDSSGTLAQWPGATATWSVLPGATAQVRLWRWTDDATPLGTWTLVGPADNLAAYFGSKTNYIFAEALSSGRATVRITTTLGGQVVHDDIEVKSGVGELAVDANRDGVIKLSSEDASDATSSTNPYRFWINDDDDSGDTLGTDIPGQTPRPNYADSVVNGTRDLVDFFPVFLDIKQLLAALPPSASVKYKLKQADSALNFVYTNLTRDHASDYETQLLASGFSDTLDKAPGVAITHQITASGVDLAQYCPSFLTGIRDSGWGVLLIEGRAVTTAPLVLSVEQSNGTVIAQVQLPLRINNVEDMFRHLSLRSVAKNYDGSPDVPADLGPATKMNDPGDPLPDSTTNGKYFVFVHGYNVDAAHARGWEAEVFKRMFVMGSHARFIGVSWYGSTGLDYHKAVFYAFQTGDVLNGQLSLPAGSDVTVVAHSLGNMVVSQAIQSGGFSPSRYYMINAAVPLEAYDNDNGSVTAQQRTAMTEGKWTTESSTTFAANWHQWFGATLSDHRNELKWKNRFSSVLTSTAVFNFYSPGDDVVENPEWNSASVLGTILAQGFNFSRGAWVTQEFAKGANIVEFPPIKFFDRVQGGWGQSVYYWPTGPSKRSTDQTREPYFGYFLEDVLFGVDATKASTKAGDKTVQYDLLARGIPALSFAAAVNPLVPLVALNRNFDMELRGRTVSTDAQGLQTPIWPTEGHTADRQSPGRWLHSDFKNVALPYVYQMYQEMIRRASLK